MSIRDAIATDLVVSPLGADVPSMVDVARCAEDSGFDGVWTLDHFSGAMLDRPWSHEPFTVLGAMASVTDTVRIGPLVANMRNRHPAILASAAASLQSLSQGRAVIGVGSGAAPGSRFAGEQEAIGRLLGSGSERREYLIETLAIVRQLFAGGGDHDGTHLHMHGWSGVVEPVPLPPFIVGASGPLTVELACHHADGVNIRVTPETGDLLRMANDLRSGSAFETSIWTELDTTHPLGGDADDWVDLGVHRRTLAIAPPFDLDAVATIGARLNA